MAFNGSGTFTVDTANATAVYGQEYTPVTHNAILAELAAGLTNCITKDGQTTVTANIPMNSKLFTGLLAGSARTDSASIQNIVQNTGVYVSTVGGTVDAITLTPSPAITSYGAGQEFLFISTGANTGAVTVNVNSLGAKAITKNGTTALSAGDIGASAMVRIVYDGTRFQKV